MRIFLVTAVLSVLAGCGGMYPLTGQVEPIGGPVGVVEGLSLIGTKKTVGDHVYSLYTGKDCSTVRRELGRSYCVEDEIEPTPQVHCYKTLGSVTCYEKPDPYRNKHQKLGNNDHNLLRPRP